MNNNIVIHSIHNYRIYAILANQTNESVTLIIFIKYKIIKKFYFNIKYMITLFWITLYKSISPHSFSNLSLSFHGILYFPLTFSISLCFSVTVCYLSYMILSYL